jgi:hypothetical protein
MILPGKDDATYHTQEIYSRDRSKRFFHAPALTVFHAGNCSSTPTLHIELPLFSEDLTVSGTLSVGGTNIAAKLLEVETQLEDVNSTLAAKLLEVETQAPAVPASTWAAIPLAYQVGLWSAANQPSYLVRDGFVYLRGHAWKPNSGTYGYYGGFTKGTSVGTLPAEATPSEPLFVTANARNAPMVLLVLSNGDISIYGCGQAINNDASVCQATGQDTSRNGFWHSDLGLDGVVFSLYR